MQNYSPIYNFNGSVRAANAPSHVDDLVRKQDAAGLSYISSIAAGSQAYLNVSAAGALSVDSLLISDVTVDGTQTSLANYIANESAGAAALKKGDILVLTNATGGAETYIVSGLNGSAIGNYTKIESALTAAEIVALLTGGTGINIAANGTISFNGDTDVVAEGSSNLYYTEGRFSNSGTGSFSVTTYKTSNFNTDFAGKTTANLTENTNLYHTTARARTSVSASGDLSYNNSTGVFSVTTYKTADFNSDFSGQNTSNLSEGTNLYHTTARARAAVSGSAGVTYDSASGVMSLDEGHIRYSDTITLVANTAFVVNHGLAQKFVHVSVYDSSGNKIHADVVLTDANNLSVTSVSGLSGAQVICSL